MPTCPFHYPHHRSTEQQLIDRFIDAFPLATITSRQEDVFISSHIPLLRQSDGSLFGHVDVKNPQFNKTQRLSCQIIFMGPSAYIPPTPTFPTSCQHGITWPFICKRKLLFRVTLAKTSIPCSKPPSACQRKRRIIVSTPMTLELWLTYIISGALRFSPNM